MRRLRTSYANVTSTLALVVALGGTGAYAVNTIGSADIKPGAVKSSDLGKNAVTSPKVKDGQLRLKDLNASARTSASQAHRPGLSPTLPGPGTHSLATLRLKAGQYVLLASTGYQPTNAGATVGCRLRVNATAVAARFVTNNGVEDHNCTTHTVAKLTKPGSVVLEIEVEAGDVKVRDPKVTAIRVGSVSDVQVSG
jgi:hypothetical protein